MPRCALPNHLKNRLHSDYIWPFNYIPRAQNAYGPRCLRDQCECGGNGYRPWPPALIEGCGVARWEETGPGHSIICIPELADKEVKGKDVYGREFSAYEMNPGIPGYGKVKQVYLNLGSGYSPSSLQKFSRKGWMRLDPHYYCQWNILKQREPEEDDIVLFYRNGYRVDHEDMYYNKTIFTPYIGLHWE